MPKIAAKTDIGINTSPASIIVFFKLIIKLQLLWRDDFNNGYNFIDQFNLVFLFGMKYFAFVIVLIQLFFVQAQEFKTAFFKDYSINADKFIGVDDFENSYYINHNNLYKKTAQTIYSYANSQLGEITSVDITNPLKILVFYRDFNAVLLLDNRLNELTTPY